MAGNGGVGEAGRYNATPRTLDHLANKNLVNLREESFGAAEGNPNFIRSAVSLSETGY